MDDSILRKRIRETLSEFFNNASVYPDDHNKFPYFDETDSKTPSDLDWEADSLSDNIEKYEKNVGLTKSTKKSIIPNSH